jgi:PIN domain nuclease of toxin-antitoxin system
VSYLLDAHTLIWSQDDPSRLSATAATVIRDRGNVLIVGMETVWE